MKFLYCIENEYKILPFVLPKLFICFSFTGALFSLILSLFVVWKEFAVDFPKYISIERSNRCVPENVLIDIKYGWSFMFAAFGTPFICMSGIMFHFIGRQLEEFWKWTRSNEETIEKSDQIPAGCFYKTNSRVGA